MYGRLCAMKMNIQFMVQFMNFIRNQNHTIDGKALTTTTCRDEHSIVEYLSNFCDEYSEVTN